jgi:tRNA(fMet)-specific endonuclease VapC
MAFLLDTDIVIDYLGGDVPTKQLVDPLAGSGLAIGMVSYMEVYQGILEDPDPATAEAEFEAFLRAVALLPLSTAVARRCARLRRGLKQQGKRFRARALDLISAATALEYDLTLVTRNKADYADIPGLTLH